MGVGAEIYNYERTLERVITNLNASSIDDKNKTAIFEFHKHCLANGYSLARTIKYITTLRMFANELNKPFEDACKEDIFKLVQHIEQSNYSDWTKHDYKAMLRIFYKWLRKTEDFPEEVKWIRPGKRRKNILPEELIKEEEIKKLAEFATNPRDKALVLVLYESGCRPGEVLTLRIRNVQFDSYGAVLLVKGKTGHRRVRIIASAPALATWLDTHPLKNDANAPLWVGIGARNNGSILKYSAAKSVIKDLAEKAGIRKRVYPYLFRHSRATKLANSLTDAQLKQHFGWTQDSKMASTYIHLSGRDVDAALLKLQGMEIEKREVEDSLKISICPRCKNKNSPASKYCNACGLALDIRVAMELDGVRAKADRLMTELVKNPEVLDTLLAGIEKLKERFIEG
jgi:integrase/ribosomal protein L40E